MPTSTLSVRVPPETTKRLDKLAKATHRSRSQLAAEAIEEYLAVQEWQVEAIQAGLDQSRQGRGVDLQEVRVTWESRLEDPPDRPGRC